MGARAVVVGGMSELAPRRAPAGPLALVLGVHLVAAWWWLTSSATMPALPGAATALRELFIVPVLPPMRPAPPPPIEVAAPVVKPSAPARIAPIPVAPSPSPDPAPAAVDDVVAKPSSQGEAAPAESTAARALRAAGAADHALRGGKAVPLSPADTPWNRFVQGVEGARKDTSRTLKSETYTAPDGTVIYRFRQGGRVWCRTGGHVRPLLGGAEGGGAAQFDRRGSEGAAGTTPCPSQAQFEPD